MLFSGIRTSSSVCPIPCLLSQCSIVGKTQDTRNDVRARDRYSNIKITGRKETVYGVGPLLTSLLQSRNGTNYRKNRAVSAQIIIEPSSG